MSCTKIKNIKIADLTGKTIVNNAPSGTKAQLLVSDLPEGIYFLTMKTSEGNYTEKLIKK
ncbi:MAG: T9SS type A sorting domain-containing protein [Paludibacter sp.]|nr:T9SS type A sorting domain-containing protein [Paludibacter sp.]